MECQLANYELVELLVNNRERAVYLGRRLSDDQLVFIKKPHGQDSNDLLVRCQTEYELLSGLNIPGVIRACEVVEHEGGAALVLEHFDAGPLSEWIADREHSLLERLSLAINLATTLGRVHEAGIVHQNVSSENILVNPATNEILLINFALGTRLSSEHSDTPRGPTAERSLAYISPEQTGRTNRKVDDRTDWYSLGMVLYELFSGRLPFASRDPLDWIHFHLAGETAPLSEAAPEAPEMVSAIVAKLLKRAPEDRYQSSAGIVADLSRCAESLKKGSEIAAFELGAGDLNERFELPQAIFGCDVELDALNQAFGRVTDGGVEIVRIVGRQGSGKSALAQQLRLPTTHHRGFFVSASGRKATSDQAFQPLLATLSELVLLLLTESEEAVEQWREVILAALGDNGQLIIDVLPELEHLIGRQAATSRLPDSASRTRFRNTFLAFVRALAAQTHPLVLFLDDMQWADAATVQMLELLVSDDAVESLLLIEAYDADDASFLAPDASSSRRTLIELKPLGTEPIAELIAWALRREIADVRPLAEIVARKTGGKPLYVRQFLSSLHEAGHISFDRQTARFDFELASAREAETTDNVAEVMAAKLGSLDDASQRVLKLAAIVGRSFDVVLLARVAEYSVAETLELLKPAYDAGFIVAATDQSGIYSSATGLALPRRLFTFSHNRLHRAAYELGDGHEHATLHLTVGRALLAGNNEQQLERNLLETVSHFNAASDLLESEVERLRIAELNLRAAEKMRNATAYESAASYYAAAIEFLGAQGWKTDRRLAIKLHSKLVEVLFLEGQLEAARHRIETTLEHTDAIAERAHLYAIAVSIELTIAGPTRALALGIEALAGLGIALDSSEQPALEIDAQLRSILDCTRQSGIAALVDKPVMRDPDLIGIMELMRRCLPAAYQADWQKFGLICCRMVIMSLEHGNCVWSSGGYGSFAVLLTGLPDGYRDADSFARLGVDVARRLDEATQVPEAIMLRATFTQHWVMPIDKCIALLETAAMQAEETGDQGSWSHATARRLGHQLFRGAPLSQLRQEADQAIRGLEEIEDNLNLKAVHGYRLFAVWLSGSKALPETHAIEQERAHTLVVQAHDNRSLQSEWYLLLLRKRFLSGEYSSALDFSRAFEALQTHSRAFVIESEHAFYTALTLAALYPGASANDQRSFAESIGGHRARLAEWAKLCPANRKSLHLLVEAEHARILGNAFDAMAWYDAAIEAAADQKFPHIEALAAELAAGFWRLFEKPEFATIYLDRAIRRYQDYGATRKVEELLALRDSCYASASRFAITEKIQRERAGNTTQRLDFASVVKASQAIAGEIVLEELLGKLIDIVLESAGGDRIALILPTKQGLLIQGIKENATEAAKLMLAEPVEKSARISRRIVNYVLRTREHLVLSEPDQGGPFQGDVYVQNRRPRSVLCAPIMHKNELAGVIYIENTQISDAFTPERLEALDILLSQIAISIENAQLYARQDDQARSIERANAALTTEIAERRRVESQLSRYRDHLEELVAQRTQEVEQANEKLKKEALGREHALKQLEKSNEQIRSLAYLDGLTGLPNRRLLNEHLDKILARCKRKHLEFAVLFVDLDNFKLINDSIGHQAADEILCELARAMNDLVRKSDVLAAHMDNEIDLDATISISPITESVLSRLGGDEFVVLLPEIRDRFAAATVAQRILDRLGIPFNMGGTEVFLAASVGIATFPYDGQTAEILLRNADTAMYHAKQLGKGAWQYYSDEMNVASVERLRLESGLRKALDENRLELHYQPQIDIATGVIVGAEALLRWNDPVRGYISPDTFVPVAESGGLILQIGEWVMHEATRQAMEWRAAGLPAIPLAVNVSGTQIKRQDIVGLVRRALDESGLDPSALCIEITETSLMSVLDRAAEVLHRLRALGVSTALDDFGTGYSSLSYLKSFPLDSLKIDRSFIAELLTDAKTAALTEAIVNMTRILNLKVVAEGIESADQLAYLRKLGCSIAQGFYFSPAVSPDEFARLLAARPARWRPSGNSSAGPNSV